MFLKLAWTLFEEGAGVSSWKKGYYASSVPHTQVTEHPWIKAEFQETFFEILYISYWYPGSGEVLDCIDS